LKSKNFAIQLDVYGLKSKEVTLSDAKESVGDLEPETFSLLSIPIQTNLVIVSGNLKVKCVVSMWNIFHKSNEISIEILVRLGVRARHVLYRK
jgi:hypothetical protein